MFYILYCTQYFMKTFIYILLTIQICCLAGGIYLFTQGDMFGGLFTIIVNAVFIPVNINTLRKCD